MWIEVARHEAVDDPVKLADIALIHSHASHDEVVDRVVERAALIYVKEYHCPPLTAYLGTV